eukprot:6480171-Amphidinium_carterae.2
MAPSSSISTNRGRRSGGKLSLPLPWCNRGNPLLCPPLLGLDLAGTAPVHWAGPFGGGRRSTTSSKEAQQLHRNESHEPTLENCRRQSQESALPPVSDCGMRPRGRSFSHGPAAVCGWAHVCVWAAVAVLFLDVLTSQVEGIACPRAAAVISHAPTSWRHPDLAGSKPPMSLLALVRQPGAFRYGGLSPRTAYQSGHGQLPREMRNSSLCKRPFWPSEASDQQSMKPRHVSIMAFSCQPSRPVKADRKVAVPAIVPHGGDLYDKGRWTHAIVPLELGGRTLHVFNLYAYDESYEDHGERNRALLQELLPHVFALRDHPYIVGGDWNFEPDDFPIDLARGDTLVRPPSDNLPTSPNDGRKIDWFLISRT